MFIYGTVLGTVGGVGEVVASATLTTATLCIVKFLQKVSGVLYAIVCRSMKRTSIN